MVSFSARLLLLAALALGVAANPIDTSTPSTTTLPVGAGIDACSLVRCRGDYVCKIIDGKAVCIPRGGEKCGAVTCGEGLECCNPSCNICVKPGWSCTQQVCARGEPEPEPEPAATAPAPIETVKPDPTLTPRPLVKCGWNTCAVGDVCCNESCGICTKPGGFCTQQFCTPTKCGRTECAGGQVCCNASCGICTPPGGFCTQQICN
jgi:hypothetical protein